jgi:RNA polymerase sigma factor (sigma-70 family)
MTTATISYLPADAPDTLPDLLLRINDRDPTAWDEILRRYGKLVSTTVRLFRLQEADALDAIQMTWMRLAENANRVQFPERLSGWLATTARRECLHILRQTKLKAHHADVTPESVFEPSTGPEQRVIDAHTTRTLRKLIDELPSRRRTLLRMLFSDEPYTYAEVACIAEIPLGGIGPTRTRALRQLRNKLEKAGFCWTERDTEDRHADSEFMR